MRKYLLIITGFFLAINVSGQYNYYRFSGGIGAGVNTSFTDVKEPKLGTSIVGSFDYNFTPFLSLGLEVQKGTLSAGDSTKYEGGFHNRFFKNSYTSFAINGKAQLGQFIDFESSNFLYAIRGFYVGTGVGIIQNKMTDIVRVQPNTNYLFPGEDKSSNILIPINTGINFNILDRWGYTRYILSLNYQMNVTIGEGLDGYHDPSAKFKNKYPDFYSVLSAGVKICFGPEGLY